MTVATFESLATLLEEANKVNTEDLSKQPGYDEARVRALRAVEQLHQRLETPLEFSRRIGWQEPAHVASIKIALNLGLLARLKECGRNGSLSIHELAESTGANEELVGRILRHLSSWGTVQEAELYRYSSTVLSAALLEPKVASGIDYWIHMGSIGLRSLPFVIQEEGYENLGTSVWQRASNTDQGLFEWLQANPEAFTMFTNMMSGFTEGRAQWTHMYPIQDRLLQGAEVSGPLIVDVGGGVGQDVALFQRQFPQPAGRLFVQDQPAVIFEAQKRGLDLAIEAQAHDFFAPQPIVGARAYLLHYILHDWLDEMALKILDNIKPAMRRDYSRLLIAEYVVANEHPDPFNTAMDIVMMGVFGSKERTADDWQSLVERAGMKLVGTWSLPGNHESVIEVVLS